MSGKNRWRGVLSISAATIVAVGVAIAIRIQHPKLTVIGQKIDQASFADRAGAALPPTTRLTVDHPTPPATYMDEVRAEFPTGATTRPLPAPLDLNQAARIILKVPIYLSKTRGDLWLTRPDAAPDASVLKDAADPNAADPQSHVFSKRVVFVHWLVNGAESPVPYVVCVNNEGGFDVVWAHGRAPLNAGREYLWAGAFSWDNDKAVVPTRNGISILTFGTHIDESYRELRIAPVALDASKNSAKTPPQVLFDGQGLLTWVPWEHGRPGSEGALRYLKDQWIDMGPEQGWPEKLVHLVPLRDGTVFQFTVGKDGSITVQTAALETTPIDESAIEKLVAQLSDIDADVRRTAVSELANYGPGAWPSLTRLAEDQPPQAKLLLREILKDKNHPTLSGMTLLGSQSLQLGTHLSDGGVVFYAAQGVSIPDLNGDPVTFAPAWLSVRPGHFVELLPATLVADLKPDDGGLDVIGDQWIANTNTQGPRLFYGNGFATLLRKSERQFSQVIGMDQRGRWLFRKPAPTDDRQTSGADDQTLILDPHLPDPTPRLPVWNLAIAKNVGWDRDNWPVIQNGAAFALTASDWRGLGKDEEFFTRIAPPPQAPIHSISVSTRPSSGPVINVDQASAILTEADGTRYFGGQSELKVISVNGESIDWPLPAMAVGSGPVTLIRADSGKFYLFNQPGRVLRISRNRDAGAPFTLEATFVHGIPSVKQPTRIWMDPAGRIDIVWENRLAVLFPDGFIPRAISEKMLDQSGLDAESP